MMKLFTALLTCTFALVATDALAAASARGALALPEESTATEHEEKRIWVNNRSRATRHSFAAPFREAGFTWHVGYDPETSVKAGHAREHWRSGCYLKTLRRAAEKGDRIRTIKRARAHAGKYAFLAHEEHTAQADERYTDYTLAEKQKEAASTIIRWFHHLQNQSSMRQALLKLKDEMVSTLSKESVDRFNAVAASRALEEREFEDGLSDIVANDIESLLHTAYGAADCESPLHRATTVDRAGNCILQCDARNYVPVCETLSGILSGYCTEEVIGTTIFPGQPISYEALAKKITSSLFTAYYCVEHECWWGDCTDDHEC